ncbi:MAG: TetR/AcrR family transcriptional regulator [Gammaproteobacteria bacterium]|nr:TetR/AcrR family transcriptional regulator [Gammaproteobacteria bacterium]
MVRKPTQQRAKVTVDTIIQAGFIAVAKSGMRDATTRQIAEISGIGVGSLYEYFKNKEAIYEAMNQRFVDDIVLMLRRLTPELVRLNLQDLVELLLRNFGDLLQKDNAVYLKYVRYSRYSPQIESALMEMAMHYVMNNPRYLRLSNMPTITYICINGGIYSIVRHLSSPPPNVSYEDMVQGLARMTTSYVDAELARLPQFPE